MRYLTTVLLIAAFFILYPGQSGHSIFKVRPYGWLGFSAINNDLYSQLDRIKQSNSAGSVTTETFSYGGGLQVVFCLTDTVFLGIDSGYFHSHNVKMHSTSYGRSDLVVDYMNISGLIEWKPWELMLFQVGGGYYIDMGRYEHNNDLSPNYKASNGAGLHMAGGIELALNDSKTILLPIMVRFDMIFTDKYRSSAPDAGSKSANGLLTPVRLMMGVSIRLF